MNTLVPSSRLAAGKSASRSQDDSGKTSPTLLVRVRDWGDHPAWVAFFERYDPLLHRWCGRFGLDGDTSDELCQRIWIELTSRLRTFRYDPSLGFRGWLWRLFHSRAIDWLRCRRTTQVPSLDAVPLMESRLIHQDWHSAHDEDGPDTEPGSAPSILFRQAEEVQEAVRARVDRDTWHAYWFVAIEDQPVREAAVALGKSYTAVYTGYKRVDRMLRQEGQRRLAALVRTAVAAD
jgi:RNA polymerase sigma factor (sigma-70 family)